MQLKAWASAAAFAVAGGAIVLAPGNMPAATLRSNLGHVWLATPGDAPDVVRVTRGGRLALHERISRASVTRTKTCRGIFDSGRLR
jgi:hypothetical protein